MSSHIAELEVHAAHDRIAFEVHIIAAGDVFKRAELDCAVGPEDHTVAAADLLNAACDQVRALLYPTWRGDLKRYLHVPTLLDPQRGVLAALLPREAANFAAANAAAERWRAARPSPADVLAFAGELAKGTLAAIEQFLASQTPAPSPPPG